MIFSLTPFSICMIRHWLFGEKMENAKTKKTRKNGTNGKEKEKEKEDLKSVRVRGWFPRQCAVELVDPESDDEHDHFTAKKTN